MNLLDLKSKVLNRWTQFVLMDADGEFMESCDTLFRIEKGTINLVDQVPFIDSISELLNELTFGQELAFPCINMDEFGYEGICDYLFYKIQYQDKSCILWVLVNFSEHYTHLIDLQQQRNESSIQKELLEVEKRNAVLAKELLQFKNHELRRTQKVKTDFFSKVSHEIRTPVNGILGMAELVKSTDNIKKIREYADTIYAASKHLSSILNDVLDLSKIESGKLTFESIPFELHRVIHTVVQPFIYMGKQKGIQVAYTIEDSVPEVLVGDEVKLSQVLYNLLSNALKFTSKGKIVLSIAPEFESEEKGTIKFEIRDTGIGIPNEKLKQIFEPYEQVDVSTSRQYGGTGLGLHITKQLIELQGGSISVDTKVNKGSKFTIKLPYVFIHSDETISTSKEVARTVSKGELAGLNILIGEDDLINQKLLHEFVINWGAHPDVVENGEEVIAKITQNQYDLLIIDYLMPKKNGLDTIKYIRNEMADDKNYLPIILFTGESNQVLIKQFKYLHVAAILHKPIEPYLLFQEIKKVIHKGGVRNFDLSYAVAITNGNSKLIAEMIEIFINTVPSQINDMERNVIERNELELKKILHKIKPNFHYLGLSKAEEVFTQLEKGLEKNMLEESQMTLILSLKSMVNRVAEELKRELPRWQVKK